MQLRKKYQEAFTKKHGVKLGLMSPFIRASALALQEQPIINAGKFLELYIFSSSFFLIFFFLITFWIYLPTFGYI